MFMMVNYVKEMTVKKSCLVNMDRLSICSSCYIDQGDCLICVCTMYLFVYFCLCVCLYMCMCAGVCVCMCLCVCVCVCAY